MSNTRRCPCWFFVDDLVTYQSHIKITTNSVGLYQPVYPCVWFFLLMNIVKH